MRIAPLICLLGSLGLLAGCFDRDNDHPAKDADPSKPSLQMQQPNPPTANPTPETKPQNP
ncbi:MULTISPECIES: hypothetical protein [Pseudomonas]|jgi:hypothetical protein|uniref:hypothetical protein n=1 Tax=Pseudomonas TaxID=286 RepID=UPI0003C7BE9E|nr:MULTISPECIES: hypothetical protein [Pseudomonas]AIN58455.1 hypothetical protein O165_009185 [Pseudomonas soli]AUY32074.1 hypothetical protein C3F42_02030 [Pseudomonas sp. PONIH3]MDT3715705.1 hypothetical protein [Pseudomonas soli]MDT3732336.1 hypothetical protein [Pseudomonas soli]MDW9404213.1 hypothetical protein [Pseudomonas soli]